MVHSNNWITELKKNYRYSQQHDWISHITQKKGTRHKKSTHYMISFTWSSKSGQTLCGDRDQKSGYLLGVCGGKRADGMLQMFCILTWTVVKNSSNCTLRICGLVCKLYLVKIVNKQTKTIPISFSPPVLEKT